MKYKEYEKAAKRHRETCSILLKLYEEGLIGNNHLDVHQKTKILHNVYYLTGYVIECIFSYKFFELIKYDKNRPVRDLSQEGITFRKIFSRHDMKELIRIIAEKGGSKVNIIPIVGKRIVDIEAEMFDKWSTAIRYTIEDLSFELTFENVKAFYDLSDNIYKQTKKL
jgi:hypothetical protein